MSKPQLVLKLGLWLARHRLRLAVLSVILVLFSRRTIAVVADFQLEFNDAYSERLYCTLIAGLVFFN